VITNGNDAMMKDADSTTADEFAIKPTCGHRECARAAMIGLNALRVAGGYMGHLRLPDGTLSKILGLSREDVAHIALAYIMGADGDNDGGQA
jgi:hypothetical protein